MNDENILIIGDDRHEPLPTTAPADLSNTGQSWLAGRANIFAGSFLQKHDAEFQDFERTERDKMACTEQFHALKAEITSRQQRLKNLRTEIAAYQAIDISADLFKNMQLSGKPLLEIAQNPLFAAAMLIKQHGGRILKLAENDLADLQNKFDTFKSEKREVLQSLDLV
jgi:hypothetical protein